MHTIFRRVIKTELEHEIEGKADKNLVWELYSNIDNWLKWDSSNLSIKNSGKVEAPNEDIAKKIGEGISKDFSSNIENLFRLASVE